MRPPSTGLVFAVDDDPVNLQTLAEALWGEAFEVAFAVDGETAIAQIREQLPDVIILDALMPGMTGFDICKQLKADPATSDIPILFMTALTDVADRLRGFALGAADYLTKPFVHEELRARVKTQLTLRLTLRALAEKNKELEHELAERKRSEEERVSLVTQVLAAQEARLAEMSTPIIPITDHILVMPLIGIMDDARAALVVESALKRATEGGAEVMILDMTGVLRADDAVAQAIINTTRALRLLGLRTILTGIRPDVARTFVELNVDLSEVLMASTVQMGVTYAMRIEKERKKH
jgi:DNA-binding response OmpR family regulator/anti-anti-sigma regulatory factor